MVLFKVFRYNSEIDEDSTFEEYEVENEEGKTVLDGLREIKAEKDDSLSFRLACEAGVCGSCAMIINGKPRLACKTQIERDLQKERNNNMVKVEPLEGFEIIKDLVTDLESFFKEMKGLKPYLITDSEPSEGEERLQSPENMMEVDNPLSCIMCTACLSACPISWTSERYPGPALLAKMSRFYLDSRDMGKERMDLIAEDIWDCTTCRNCVEVCPKDVDIPTNVAKMREYFIQTGNFPPNLQDALESSFTKGNPYQESRRKREEWSKELEVPKYEDQNVLWYVGCTLSYNDRAQEVAKSMAKVLNNTKIPYGVLGKKENCCGHPAKRSGENALFEELLEENQEAFKNLSADKIVANCAHGYHTLQNEYSLEAEVLHSTQFLNQKEISFSQELNKKITYHDPCYLGRYNGIYEQPRELLKRISGTELVEMEENRDTALCCGGGGNHIWIEEPEYIKGRKRLAYERVDEAIGTGADILAVACPFCLTIFDDAVKTTDHEGDIEIRDVTELIAEAL